MNRRLFVLAAPAIILRPGLLMRVKPPDLMYDAAGYKRLFRAMNEQITESLEQILVARTYIIFYVPL